MLIAALLMKSQGLFHSSLLLKSLLIKQLGPQTVGSLSELRNLVGLSCFSFTTVNKILNTPRGKVGDSLTLAPSGPYVHHAASYAAPYAHAGAAEKKLS